jgi:translocation and assembly module TamB
MKRPTWLRKALLLFPILSILLVVTALVALRLYLSSAGATRQVAERLQDMLGGRVEVQQSQIGLTGDSTVQGITAYEDGQADKPWLQIDGVKADVSALSVLRDKSPEAIRVQGARIGLRFDSAGHLLTQLPKQKPGPAPQLPHLHIEQGVLTFDQDGRPPMIVRGIDADIVPGDKGVTLTGTITDPFWGDWQVQGDLDTAAGKSSIVLNATEIAVTMEKLKTIAFVPPKVWQQVQVEGPTPARVQLDMDTGGDKPSVHYRVEIAPHHARVQVTSIDLDATETTGKAVIVDELVQLDDVRGKIAGGAITTSGDLNFRGETSRLAFKVGVQGVVLHDLPRSWKVPPKIDGRLTGKADLVVTLKNGKVRTEGSGKGEIDQARWGRIKIQKPISLTLHSENGRFRFGQPKTAALALDDAKELAHADEGSRPKKAPLAAANREEDDEGDADLLESVPRRLVNVLNRGIQMGVDQLSRGMDAAARALGKLKPPKSAEEEPTYLDVDLNLKDVDLLRLVQKLKLRLPYAITGRVTIQVHASIPINTPGDMKAYRLRGDAKLPRFNVAGLEMTDVAARVRYAKGVLDLEELKGQVPRPKDPKTTGKFEGSAHVQVVPQGDLQASVKVDRVPLDVALNLLPATKDQAMGLLTGTIQGRAPMASLSDLATWRGGATLTAPSIEVYGVTLSKTSASLTINQGRATLTTFKADVEGTPLTGKGDLDLKGAYPFQAELHLDRTDLAALNRLSPSFRPPIDIKGSVELNGSLTGTLKPVKFDTLGAVQAKNLVAEGFKVDDLSFHWSKDENRLKLEAIKADLYSGTITGSAAVPLSAAAVGTAKLNIRDVDAQKLSKSIPSFPVRLEGKVSGTVKGQMPAAAPNRPRGWTTDVELAAPRLRVQGIPAEKLKGTVDSQGGKTSYRLEGESLGGTFSIKGDLPAHSKEKKEKPQEPTGRGRLEVRGAQLARLWDAYNITGGLSHLRGRFSIDLPYRHEGANDFPVGEGTFRIVNIRWDEDELADSFQGEVRLTSNQLRLSNISGDFAQGLFRGQFVFALGNGQQGWFHINLQQVEASRLLVPLPAVAAHVRGPTDVSLRGRIGPEWDGSGEAALTRGQVFGLDLTEWRIPMQFSFAPAHGTGELTVRDSQARIAQGRATFQSTLNWGNGLRLTGLLLFYQVDLRTLLRHSPELSSYASGRVSGRVELGGSEMRSINDLTAIVQAKLQQGQALQMPVLRQITPYLRPGVSSATFQSGQFKGRLAGGIFRIQHATLVGDFLQLIIEGTVNLVGNLNLDVTAQTGTYCLNPAKANAVGVRIPLIGAIPRLLLYEASSVLANRVVHLRVTGTVSSPSVRLEPILLMTEEAIRFFLGRLLSPSIPNVP